MAKTETTQRTAYVGRDGLGGGLVSENAISLATNQLVEASNMLVGTALTRRKRGGQAPWHTGAYEGTGNYPPQGTPTRAFVELWKTAGVGGTPVSYLFLHNGTKVYSMDTRASVATDRTGVLVLSATSVPSYQPFNQKVYFCSTVTADGYNQWTPGGAAVAAVAPADGPGKYLCAHLGRMVMAGNDTYPFRVYLSDFLDPENWSSVAPHTSTSLDLDDDGDPQGITGLASFQSRLYVWTRRATYEITGTSPDDFLVLKVSNGIGAISHASIVPIPNDVVFASDRGVHSLRQLDAGRQTETKFISFDIQRLWTELLNPALFTRITAAYDETINCYMISVPSSGQTKNDQILAVNLEFGIWFKWPDMNARSIGTVLINNKKNVMIGREDSRLILVNQVNRNDLGVGYTMHFKTGLLYPGEMAKQKCFKRVTVLASTTTPTDYTVSWSIDGVKNGFKNIRLEAGEDVLGTTFVLGTSKLGVGQYTPKTASIDDTGYGIQIEITCGGTGDIEVYGFIIETEDVNAPYDN